MTNITFNSTQLLQIESKYILTKYILTKYILTVNSKNQNLIGLKVLEKEIKNKKIDASS